MEDKVLLIKHLIQKGYKDKHICMIAQAKQPYVSKIRNGKIHKNTNLNPGERLELTQDQTKRLEAVNRILTLPEILTPGTTDNDIVYMHVLKFFMVEQEDVYNLYFHLSKSGFRNLWRMKGVDILSFNSELIGIEQQVYLDLIIDYFI